MSENLKLIKEISADLRVDAAFIEKDQYSMQLISELAEVSHPKIQLVFSGGTSLSKGHGLISRFSEDLDFKVSLNGEVTRKDRRDFREQVIEAIGKSSNLSVSKENVKSGNGSRFFKMQVYYPQVLEPSDALRPHIQLEVSFEEPQLQPEDRALTSFVAQAKGEGPEVESIPCISPVETAADKLSALTWRVLDRDRTQPNDDPALVRHLHDLAALKNTVEGSSQFEELALNSLEKDVGRSKTEGTDTLSTVERMDSMLQTLKSDPLYKDEFAKFVTDLSYASDESRPTYESSLASLEGLIERVQQQYFAPVNSMDLEPGSKADVLDAARYIAKELGERDGSGELIFETDEFKIEAHGEELKVWNGSGEKVIDIASDAKEETYHPSPGFAGILTSAANELEQQEFEREEQAIELDDGLEI